MNNESSWFASGSLVDFSPRFATTDLAIELNLDTWPFKKVKNPTLYYPMTACATTARTLFLTSWCIMHVLPIVYAIVVSSFPFVTAGTMSPNVTLCILMNTSQIQSFSW